VAFVGQPPTENVFPEPLDTLEAQAAQIAQAGGFLASAREHNRTVPLCAPLEAQAAQAQAAQMAQGAVSSRLLANTVEPSPCAPPRAPVRSGLYIYLKLYFIA